MATSEVVTGLWGGKRHGSFAGKTAGSTRPAHAANEVVTGLWGGKKHSTFSGKTEGVVQRPAHAANQVVTGLWGGKKHSSFAGKTAGITTPSKQRDGKGFDRFKDLPQRLRYKKVPDKVIELIADIAVDQPQAPVIALKQSLKTFHIPYKTEYGSILKEEIQYQVSLEIKRLIQEDEERNIAMLFFMV